MCPARSEAAVRSMSGIFLDNLLTFSKNVEIALPSGTLMPEREKNDCANAR